MLHIVWQEFKKFKIFLLVVLLLPLVGQSSIPSGNDAWLGIAGMMLLWNVVTVGVFSIQVFTHDIVHKTIFFLLEKPLSRKKIFLAKLCPLLIVLVFVSFWQLIAVTWKLQFPLFDKGFFNSYILILINGLFLIAFMALFNQIFQAAYHRIQIALISSYALGALIYWMINIMGHMQNPDAWAAYVKSSYTQIFFHYLFFQNFFLKATDGSWSLAPIYLAAFALAALVFLAIALWRCSKLNFYS